MKRIPWKEMLLLTLPIGIIGLGIWGAQVREQVREQVWPTKARIVECRVRPPVPVEVFLGAEVGVTVRALYPRENTICHDLRCSFARPGEGKGADKQRGSVPVSLWTEQFGILRLRTAEYEQNYAFRRSDFDSSQQLLIATPRLATSCKVRFESVAQEPVILSAREVEPVGPASVQRANFRVTKVEVESSTDIRGSQPIYVHLADIKDECPGLTMMPRVVGNWKWQGSKTHSLRASVGAMTGYGEPNRRVQVSVHTGGFKPPPAGTKLSGLFTLDGGWPQEITVIWPNELDKNSTYTEAKFSTKLAPLPSRSLAAGAR